MFQFSFNRYFKRNLLPKPHRRVGEGRFTPLNSCKTNLTGFTPLNPPRAVRSNLTGFTLIETLTALTILLVAILSLSYAIGTGVQISKNSERSTQALILAQNKIEELINKEYTLLTVGVFEEKHRLSVDPNSPFYHYQQEVIINWVDPENNLQNIDQESGIKKIIVYIFWPTFFRVTDQQIELISLVSQK